MRSGMASQAVSKGSKRLKLSPNSDEQDEIGDDVKSCTADEQGQSIDTTLDEKTIKSSDKHEAV